MFVTLFKSKIHRATVTEANLHYVGSITIAADLMDAAGIVQHERVQVLNLTNGARLETYVIPGELGSGVICMNGPSAHFFTPRDLAIIIAYAMMTSEEAKTWHPTTVFVNEKNEVTGITRAETPMTVEDGKNE